MENKVKVKSKNLAQSPQKLRLVADMVRGMDVEEALDTLKFVNKKGSKFIAETINSGVAAAQEKLDAEPSELVISQISVDQAPFYTRYRFASRGRVAKIQKRRSNLNLELTKVK